MVKQSKVKSYVRNGKTVKSYNRSIKDAVRQVGSVVGAGLGGIAAVKYGRRVPLALPDKFVLGALGGALLGGVPARLVNKDNKKAKQQLKSAATIGGGIAGLGLATLGGVKGYKFIKARNTKSLVLFNPNESYRNTVAAFNIKAREQARTAPKDLNELRRKYQSLYSNSDLQSADLSINLYGIKSKMNKSPTASDVLKMYDETLTPIAKRIVIDSERVAAVEGKDGLRDTIYKAVTKDLDIPLSKAERRYFAGVAKMNDPAVREAERKVLKKSLDAYAKANNIDTTRVNGSVDLNKIIKSLKERGFTELDIKQMIDKHNNIKL
jgi:outer membrane lipoprotein SlyB